MNETIEGVVRDGVIVIASGSLPEGTLVRVVAVPALDHPLVGDAPPMSDEGDEEAELRGWERLSDEAWATIDWGEGDIARDPG